MMNSSTKILFTVCPCLIAFVLAGVVTLRITHGQTINGIPNQSMTNFTNVVVTTMQIGSSVPLNYSGVLTSSSATPGSIAAGTCADTSYTFTGAAVGAVVSGVALASGTQSTNISYGGPEPIVSANTVPVRWCNNSLLTTQTPTAGALKAKFDW